MLKFNPITGDFDFVNQPYDPTTDTIHVLKAGDTMTGTLNGRSIIPTANNTYDLGSTGNYYNRAYATRYSLNSTAYIDGATAGMIGMQGRAELQATISTSALAAMRVTAFPSNIGQTYGLRLGVVGQTASGSYTGVIGEVFFSGTGTLTSGIGAQGTFTLQGSTAATVNLAEAFKAVINVTSTNASSNIVNARGMSIPTPSTTGSGTITNGYGLYIEDQNKGTGSNYAIATNAGNVVINEGGDANTDVRIEGDTDQNLLFTDASVDMVGIGTSAPTAKLDINSDKVRVRSAKTPSSATDTGNQGDICWDSNYVYVCVATNTWKRAALSTW